MSSNRSRPADAPVGETIAYAFPDSRTDTIAALVNAGRVTAFSAGEKILDQGDRGWLVLALSGHIGIRRTTIDGRQLISRIATRGELGTILPLAARPAAGDVFALTDCEVVMWWPSEVRARAANDAGFALAIMDHILASVETLVERIDGLLYQDAMTRVARVLYAHQDLFFSDPPVLSRTHLPALVGTSREMTSRVLRALEAKGLVARVGRDRLAIIDADSLETAVVGPSGLRPRDVRNKFLAVPRGRMTEFDDAER
jgi:CRP-like cAMP-binding protein